MNKSRIKFLPFLLLIGVLFSLFSFLPNFSANAEISMRENEIVVSNDDFQVSFQATTRKGSALYPEIKDPVTVIDEDGEGREVNYYYYNWSDISNIRITMESLSPQGKTLTGVKVVVSYSETEDLTENVNTDETIFEYTVTNIFSPTQLYYYIDENSINETELNKNGHGFGIYKFDIIYTYFDNNDAQQETPQEISRSVADNGTYFAILPDDIDAFKLNDPNNDISLSTLVTSSDTFLNAYIISINEDTFKYVNPVHIVWTVEGVDINNTLYVLTKSDAVGEFEGYAYLWDNLPEGIEDGFRYGNTFFFDSNGVEGNFNVRCSIYNSNDELITFREVAVSTVKVETISYLWLIILLIILLLVIIASVILIIILKKQEKMW